MTTAARISDTRSLRASAALALEDGWRRMLAAATEPPPDPTHDPGVVIHPVRPRP